MTQPALFTAYEIGDRVHLPNDPRALTIAGILDVDYGHVCAIVAGRCDYPPISADHLATAQRRTWPGLFYEEDDATPYTGRLYFVTGQAVFAYRPAAGLLPA